MDACSALDAGTLPLLCAMLCIRLSFQPVFRSSQSMVNQLEIPLQLPDVDLLTAVYRLSRNSCLGLILPGAISYMATLIRKTVSIVSSHFSREAAQDSSSLQSLQSTLRDVREWVRRAKLELPLDLDFVVGSDQVLARSGLQPLL